MPAEPATRLPAGSGTISDPSLTRPMVRVGCVERTDEVVAKPIGALHAPYAGLRIARGLIAMSTLAGCTPDGGADLVVGTTWPADACAEVETTFATRAAGTGARPPQIAWVRVAPGRSPADLASHRVAVDAILGGSPSTYRRLDRDGVIGPWREVRSSVAARTGSPADPTPAGARMQRSAGVTWAEGYAALVRQATAQSRTRPVEGVAIAPSARSPRVARDFIGAIGGDSPPADRVGDDLLTDLLGATLVDARPELIAAIAAVERAGVAARDSAAKLTEAPPWPPASVAELVRKRRARGDDPAPWVETLARQMVPDFEARAWLLASWDRPERPIDGELLAELARAAGGDLAREPRFRAWLRGEWREWARQRYRRVARRALGGWP